MAFVPPPKAGQPVSQHHELEDGGLYPEAGAQQQDTEQGLKTCLSPHVPLPVQGQLGTNPQYRRCEDRPVPMHPKTSFKVPPAQHGSWVFKGWSNGLFFIYPLYKQL